MSSNDPWSQSNVLHDILQGLEGNSGHDRDKQLGIDGQISEIKAVHFLSCLFNPVISELTRRTPEPLFTFYDLVRAKNFSSSSISN